MGSREVPGVVFGVTAAVLGFFGLAVLFSDYSSLTAWMVELGAIFVLFPFFLGYRVPERWWLAAVVSWGAIALFSFALVLGRDPEAVPMLLGSVAVPLAASYGGARIGSWRRDPPFPSAQHATVKRRVSSVGSS